MGIFKTTAKIAAGAAIGTFAISGLVYEGALNMRLSNKIRSLIPFENPEPDNSNPEENNTDELKEETEKTVDPGTWYHDLAVETTSIYSERIKRNTYAKVIITNPESNNWAVVFHGYSAGPGSMAVFGQKYAELGMNVILPYMIGHGPDEPHLVSMGYYDKLIGLDWIDYIISLNENAKILIHGVSMGSVTTTLLTGENLPENVVVAVADCGFTTCWDEFCTQLKALLHLPPFPFLYAANVISTLSGNFNFKDIAPLNAVIKSKTPTIFIHGEKDDFVPYRMMGELYEACKAEDKEMVTIPDAGHANSIDFHPDLYWSRVIPFVSKYLEM